MGYGLSSCLRRGDTHYYGIWPLFLFEERGALHKMRDTVGYGHQAVMLLSMVEHRELPWGTCARAWLRQHRGEG